MLNGLTAEFVLVPWNYEEEEEDEEDNEGKDKGGKMQTVLFLLARICITKETSDG